jgi:hypothetical protein
MMRTASAVFQDVTGVDDRRDRAENGLAPFPFQSAVHTVRAQEEHGERQEQESLNRHATTLTQPWAENGNAQQKGGEPKR